MAHVARHATMNPFHVTAKNIHGIRAKQTMITFMHSESKQARLFPPDVNFLGNVEIKRTNLSRWICLTCQIKSSLDPKKAHWSQRKPPFPALEMPYNKGSLLPLAFLANSEVGFCLCLTQCSFLYSMCSSMK